MTERITPTTWEQCARHVEAGGIVAVLVSAVLVAQIVAVLTRGDD